MQRLSADDPRWVGGNRMLARLGEGGMGRVYLARSARGRTVAVKCVREELAQQPDFRRRFAQEVAAARRVGAGDPQGGDVEEGAGDGAAWTAPVLDADTEAELPWVATGYIAGPSLSEVVDEQYGALPAPSVFALAAGLVRALGAIHGAGLVHRDLKPSNVLVTIDGPRVIDFGIARALDGVVESGSVRTRTGVLVGSPGFMSPEQVRGRQITPASDVFCLGAVLAYAATGRLPFGAPDSGVPAALFRIAEEEPELGGLDGPLRDLVEDCLAKDPEQRPTLAELAARTEGEPTDDWLPSAVLAQLGRGAVRLLDSEDPEAAVGGEEPAGSGAASPSSVAPSSSVAAASSAAVVPPQVGAYGPAPVMAPAAERQLQHAPGSGGRGRALSGLANALCALLGLLMLVELARLALGLTLHVQLASADEMTSSQKLADVMDGYGTLVVWSDAIDLLRGSTALALAVLGVMWFWRVRMNAERLAPGRVRFSPGMAIGCFFIPVFNFFMPKQVMNDIWRASRPPFPPAAQWNGHGPAYRPGPRLGLVHNWWWLWLLSLCLSLTDLTFWYESTSVTSARVTVALMQLNDVAALALAAVTLCLVWRLTRLQTKRLAEQN